MIGVAFMIPALHDIFESFGYPRLFKKIGKFFQQVKIPVIDIFPLSIRLLKITQ